MNSGRVQFEKKTQAVLNGRRSETWAAFYVAWADLPGLSVEERTDVYNRTLTDAIVLEVRTCAKIDELRKDMKNFRVKYDGNVYALEGADYSRRREGYIRLLASRED